MKTTAPTSHTAALSRFGHAVSDPTRVGVLLALREAPAYPSDLADALGVSRQVMSNQLACLRGCGRVEAIPEGGGPGTASATPIWRPPWTNYSGLPCAWSPIAARGPDARAENP